MQNPEDDLNSISAQFRKTHGVSPTHIEADSLIEAEIQKLNEHPAMSEKPEMIEFMKPSTGSRVFEKLNANEIPSKFVSMPHRTELVVTGDLPAMGEVEVTRQAGASIEASLLASVTLDARNYHCDIIRTADGTIKTVLTNGEGSVLRVQELEGGFNDVRTDEGSFSLTHYEGSQETWSLSYTSQDPEAQPAQIKVAETVEFIDTAKEWAEQNEKKKRQRRHRWVRRAVGAVALYATLAPGGLADRGIDPFVDTGETIRHSIELVSGQIYLEQQEELQGATIPIEQTMDDLDEHNYQAILERASGYKQSHPDQFIATDDIKRALQTIESTQSAEVVEAELNKIAAFYDYTIEASDGLSLNQLKYTGTQVVEGLSILPKSLTDQAELDTISLLTREQLQAIRGDNVNGLYKQKDTGRIAGYANIYIASTDSFDGAINDVRETVLPWLGRGYDTKSTFLHEFSHALDRGSDIAIPVNRQLEQSNTPEDVIVGGLWNSPVAISEYSRTARNENVAENISGIFSDRIDGLAHPDDARRFTSIANQAMLVNLASLEASDPGLANYLVSQNPRLMQGETLNGR